MSERQFPILKHRDMLRLFPDYPESIPWAIVAPHNDQARENHGGQTLERLAERGGLCPIELKAVLGDVPYPRNDSRTLGERLREAIDFIAQAPTKS
jgi:hypothetical protein